MVTTQIKILAFGVIAEIIQSQELFLKDIENIEQLQNVLIAKFPPLKEVKYSISLKKKIVHTNDPITSESEIALLPPFSGG